MRTIACNTMARKSAIGDVLPLLPGSRQHPNRLSVYSEPGKNKKKSANLLASENCFAHAESPPRNVCHRAAPMRHARIGEAGRRFQHNRPSLVGGAPEATSPLRAAASSGGGRLCDDSCLLAGRGAPLMEIRWRQPAAYGGGAEQAPGSFLTSLLEKNMACPGFPATFPTPRVTIVCLRNLQRQIF
ncbi:hypothetical protein DQ04_11031000 [Trypanosoma grayi]|uniref:hypothetical protein n=1 Tax=Trypanosoma grayi TaxID=71804 RepID=UPI0004F45C43|nr:hypothetical protein DQ04_11031000 [Trypanosoma grayi]KEG07069.1 hypothetical protein DQ04_11031000 [Trypanosoma grayi]